MVVSKNSNSQRIVESLLENQQLNNKNRIKNEKRKSKNGKHEQNENKNNQKNDLTVQTNKKGYLYDEFVTATPDYLSTQTYQLQQQEPQNQNQVMNYEITNNTSPIQTDYYSIYNQLASNTLLSNVLSYNPIQVNPYYSLINNVSTTSPVYSAYSDVERSAYPMYSPNYYSYPLSAPISYNNYIMPYNLGMFESPVKTKKSSKKKHTKKQALKDYLNHEQQVIDQLHKNIKENKMNKISGKKKIIKDKKELNKKNRKIASKNLKINTNSSYRVQPIFNREQIINNNNVRKDESNNESKAIFNTINVFPKYTKPEKKSSSQKEPSQQSIKPRISRNAPSGRIDEKSPTKSTNIESLLNNELTLTFLNNVYNGFNWKSKITNSKTNKNINFLTKGNTDKSNEVTSWKDSQTPGKKYSIATLLSMANCPVENGNIAKDRRVNRKELYEYWSKMAKKTMLENGKNESEKSLSSSELYIHRTVQNKAISKNNGKLKQLNKKLSKKSNVVSNEKEVDDLISEPSNHPLAKLNYLNITNNINSNNKNHHPIAVQFNEYYNHQQKMTVQKNNHVNSMIGRQAIDTVENHTQSFLNSDDPNKLYEYLLNLNFESSKKATSSSKNFASADMLKPNYSASTLNRQPNEKQFESIATFTSPTSYSIPAAVPNEVNPQYSFNYSNPSPFNNKFPLFYSQTMNYFNNENRSESLAQNNDDNKNEKVKKSQSKKSKDQNEGIENTFAKQFWNNVNNQNSILTVLPQSYSNTSLLSLASTASSSISEMDFSNVRTHYDFIIPKALPKKSKKNKEGKESKPNNQKGKSTLSQVQDINESDSTSKPDYSLISLMYNNNKNFNQPYINKKLSNNQLKSVNKNSQENTSNSSLVGYMFDSNDNINNTKEQSNTSLVGYMFD